MDLAIPIAYPDFKAHSDEINRDVPSGHAGILFVDGQHRTTNYYEYGRYDPPRNQGLVRKQVIPDAAPAGGRITVRSLKPAFKRLSQLSGHNGRLLAAWIEVDDGGFEKMRTFCIKRMQANSDPSRDGYDITSNNCCTFARDAADESSATMPLKIPLGYIFGSFLLFPPVGGALNTVTASPIPTNFLLQLLQFYPGLEFKPPDTWISKGMLRSLDVT
jgi:hypothetical protein